MAGRPLRILQTATADLAGGAERSAANLHDAYRRAGHASWMAVGSKRTADPDIFVIPNAAGRNAWVRCVESLRKRHATGIARVRGMGRLTALMRDLGQPARPIGEHLGIEDFDFPGTARLLELPPAMPDILHCHNLHGGYFDLRELPGLSHRVPTILNLRDAWLLSGHCAFSFECERWKTGCGRCPDLSIFPAVRRDATARNWQRKAAILRRSRLYLTTPSAWMMSLVADSLVMAANVENRVIPNGVDTSVFVPGDKAAARNKLGLPPDADILMCAANGIRQNVWKDYQTLSEVVRKLGEMPGGKDLMLLAVGETAPDERHGKALIRFVPFLSRHAEMVPYYQAADLYVHAARVESFGNVLLEARACGTPVVACAVGGIPEHVKSLNLACAVTGPSGRPGASPTGILTPPKDSTAMVAAIRHLIDSPALLAALGQNAVLEMTDHFSVELQAARFLRWYREILSGHAHRVPLAPSLP